jgi:hypothetical protein
MPTTGSKQAILYAKYLSPVGFLSKTFETKLFQNLKSYNFCKRSLAVKYADFLLFKQFGLFGNTPRISVNAEGNSSYGRTLFMGFSSRSTGS